MTHTSHTRCTLLGAEVRLGVFKRGVQGHERSPKGVRVLVRSKTDVDAVGCANPPDEIGVWT